MAASAERIATAAMFLADNPKVYPSPDWAGMRTVDVARQYGVVLNTLKALVHDIQEQSNIGDELCADLIHETFLPNLPDELYPVFGYEK